MIFCHEELSSSNSVLAHPRRCNPPPATPDSSLPPKVRRPEAAAGGGYLSLTTTRELCRVVSSALQVLVVSSALQVLGVGRHAARLVRDGWLTGNARAPHQNAKPGTAKILTKPRRHSDSNHHLRLPP